VCIIDVYLGTYCVVASYLGINAYVWVWLCGPCAL